MDLFYTSKNIQFHTKKINPKKQYHFYTYDFQRVGMKKETMVVPRIWLGRNKLQRERWWLIAMASYDFEQKIGFVPLKEFLRNRNYTA